MPLRPDPNRIGNLFASGSTARQRIPLTLQCRLYTLKYSTNYYLEVFQLFKATAPPLVSRRIPSKPLPPGGMRRHEHVKMRRESAKGDAVWLLPLAAVRRSPPSRQPPLRRPDQGSIGEAPNRHDVESALQRWHGFWRRMYACSIRLANAEGEERGWENFRRLRVWGKLS